LLELQSPYGLLPFQQPSDCKTVLIQDILGLDNWEHLSPSCDREGVTGELLRRAGIKVVRVP
jgi:hypothetical protein